MRVGLAPVNCTHNTFKWEVDSGGGRGLEFRDGGAGCSHGYHQTPVLTALHHYPLGNHFRKEQARSLDSEHWSCILRGTRPSELWVSS